MVSKAASTSSVKKLYFTLGISYSLHMNILPCAHLLSSCKSQSVENCHRAKHNERRTSSWHSEHYPEQRCTQIEFSFLQQQSDIDKADEQLNLKGFGPADVSRVVHFLEFGAGSHALSSGVRSFGFSVLPVDAIGSVKLS